ncbi:hypothetical protein H6F47_10315 [Sphaerospermopsis sp. FACHB-1094]|nr:hypothetical protein [Sphaerospermopsis sp. FACHB-1094]MBD2132812.1 hypothetical protein [Sphaerospermopsis sp. FACHB-1094]
MIRKHQIDYPVTSHQSPVTSPQSPVTSHQSPVTNHQPNNDRMKLIRHSS